MYYTTMRLIIVLYNHFSHKKVCFTSVYMNSTDLIAFVELGTDNLGRMGALRLGFQGADGRCEHKTFTCLHIKGY